MGVSENSSLHKDPELALEFLQRLDTVITMITVENDGNKFTYPVIWTRGVRASLKAMATPTPTTPVPSDFVAHVTNVGSGVEYLPGITVRLEDGGGYRITFDTGQWNRIITEDGSAVLWNDNGTSVKLERGCTVSEPSWVAVVERAFDGNTADDGDNTPFIMTSVGISRFSEHLGGLPKGVYTLAELRERGIPDLALRFSLNTVYAVTDNDAVGVGVVVKGGRWVTKWVTSQDVREKTDIFYENLENNDAGYTTEYQAVRMAGAEPAPVEAGTWVLIALELGRCYYEGYWRTN
jgi:hypothetical protein